MFVRFEVSLSPKTNRKTKLAICKCDVCGIEFTISKNVKKRLESEFHYCSPRHSWEGKKAGNPSDKKRKATCLERYGSELYIAQPDLASEYGKQGWGDESRAKRSETLRRRFGVDHPWNIPYAREKSREATRHPDSIAARLESYERTMMERYGVRSALQLEKTRQAMNTPECWEKRLRTMRANGSFNSSTPERHLYQLLIERFGVSDVFRHVTVPGCDKRHTIDFYVKSIDTYIQVDGVYWHGLDRPIETIKESPSKRDRAIYRKWCWDRELDQKCKTLSARLLRVTDLAVTSPGFSLDELFGRQSSMIGDQVPSS